MTELRYEARPSQPVKAADLAAANLRAKTELDQMNTLLNRAVINQVGKSFVRIQPPKDGNTVVLTTIVLSVPDTANPVPGGTTKLQSVSVSVTLSYDPSGKVVGAAVTSSDPKIQQIYQALDLNTLIQSAQDSGSGTLYGQPLTQDQPTMKVLNLPTQGLFQAILGLAGASRQAMQFQSEPLNIHTTTTYTGQDAQGNLSFAQQLSIEPWQVSLNLDSAGDAGIQMNITDIIGGGTSVFRPDGIIYSSSHRQDMTMRAQIDLAGKPYRMVMNVTYSVASTTQLKNVVLP
ncbi:hypothetical protein [Deinococcus sp. UYEF24]